MPTKTTETVHIRTGREDQLQFLRFLAFFNIFLYHADMWMFFSYPVSHCGYAAVSFFFMLSGLVAGLAYYGREVSLSPKALGSYLWSRLRKLYPLYFATTVFMVIFSGIPGMIAGGHSVDLNASFTQLARNLLLLQAWNPEGYYSFNGVGWFLSAMMFLYLLTLPAMFVLNKLDKQPRSYIIFTVLSGGILFLSAVYCYLTKRLDMSYWHYIFPPARIGEYLGGMTLGVMLRKAKQQITPGRHSRILCTVLEIAVLVFWVRSLRSPGNYWRNHIVSWLIPNILVLCVFTIGAGWLSSLFRKAPFVQLGNASFACYLVHQIIIKLYSLNNAGIEQTQAGQIFSFVYCLAISVIFALLLNGRSAAKSKEISNNCKTDKN